MPGQGLGDPTSDAGGAPRDQGDLPQEQIVAKDIHLIRQTRTKLGHAPARSCFVGLNRSPLPRYVPAGARIRPSFATNDGRTQRSSGISHIRFSSLAGMRARSIGTPSRAPAEPLGPIPSARLARYREWRFSIWAGWLGRAGNS